ncbi:MAG: hypothetical protein ACREDR_12735 [Blastocatellia bacterium]
MSTQITVNLPDDTYKRAETYAAYAERDLSEIIAAALATSLPSLEVIDELRAISKLPDDEIVTLTELRMEPGADRRLSGLLDRQQAGQLTELERAELGSLMRDYEIGLLHQSEGLAEAVRRGLLPSED